MAESLYEVAGTGAGSSGSAQAYFPVSMHFDYTTPSPVVLKTVQNGERVVAVVIDVTEAFNAPSSVSVGHSGSQTALLDTDESNTQEIGYYEVAGNHEYGGDDSIRLYINPGTSSSGAGVCYLATKR